MNIEVSFKSVAVVLCAALAAGCSSTPASKSDATAKPVQAAQAAPAAAAAAATTTTTALPDGVDQKLVHQGYRVAKNQDGTGYMYCRMVPTTGTRLASMTCLSAEQIAQEQKAASDPSSILSKQRRNNCAPHCT